MDRFRVWAPTAQRVDLWTHHGTTPMRPVAQGYWECVVEGAGPGTRYGFSLDGGPMRPDPRSPSQPQGVHGPSEVIDHGDFGWTDTGWRGQPLSGAVLYELHVGTFTPTGTFDGVIEKLPHLIELGVDAIELMPVAEFSGRHGWGYDGVDLFAPHQAYGGPEGLKRLVDACHGAGLGVVMDVVYNHLGPSGNYLAEFGPYFSERHMTNWGPAVNLDGPGSDEVRRFVLDNARMWLRDYHCDGLRLDAVHALVDDSAMHLLEELATEVHALEAHLRRPVWLIAECDRNDPKLVRSQDAGGFGLTASWADEWHHALHALLTGERSGYYADFGSLRLLAKALEQAWVYDGNWSPYRRRRHGRSPSGLTGPQFVVSSQNHDQVGNRATGERLTRLVSHGRLHIAAALLLTGPFTPLLFQGEEWGARTPFLYFTQHEDPELGRAVTRGRTREFAHFGWDPSQVPDPQAETSFTRSKLDWSEPNAPPHRELLRFYRELIALRRRTPSLSDPSLSKTHVEFDEAAGWLAMQRGAVQVVANLSSDVLSLPREPGLKVRCQSHPAVRLSEDGLSLPADSVAVLGPLNPRG